MEAPRYLYDPYGDPGEWALRRQLTKTVLQQVADERARQDNRFGIQDHPIIAVNRPGHNPDFFGMVAQECKEDWAEGVRDWATILLEEVYEALAETDPKRIREELVQVAAVAAAAIESLDRRKHGAGADNG